MGYFLVAGTGKMTSPDRPSQSALSSIRPSFVAHDGVDLQRRAVEWIADELLVVGQPEAMEAQVANISDIQLGQLATRDVLDCRERGRGLGDGLAPVGEGDGGRAWTW